MDSYIIVTAGASTYEIGAQNLARRVNERKKDGYKCVGSISVTSQNILTSTYFMFG